LRDSFIATPEEYSATTSGVGATSLCVSKTGVATSANCKLLLGKSNDSLTLLNAFPDGQPAGQTFSFFVNYIRNPLSMTEVSIIFTTFAGVKSQTMTEIVFTGLIDQADVAFTATAGAFMDPKNAKITAEVSTVQEFSTFYASFSFPVPI